MNCRLAHCHCRLDSAKEKEGVNRKSSDISRWGGYIAPSSIWACFMVADKTSMQLFFHAKIAPLFLSFKTGFDIPDIPYTAFSSHDDERQTEKDRGYEESPSKSSTKIRIRLAMMVMLFFWLKSTEFVYILKEQSCGLGNDTQFSDPRIGYTISCDQKDEREDI